MKCVDELCAYLSSAQHALMFQHACSYACCVVCGVNLYPLSTSLCLCADIISVFWARAIAVLFGYGTHASQPQEYCSLCYGTVHEYDNISVCNKLCGESGNLLCVRGVIVMAMCSHACIASSLPTVRCALSECRCMHVHGGAI